jgi:peptidoglycan/LPS O-acetylase OafA/YrhL
MGIAGTAILSAKDVNATGIPTESRKDIPALTGLRFVAAALILSNHLLIGFVARDNPYFAPGLGYSGILGMDVFFILSGFIIHYNYGQSLATPSGSSLFRFLTARFARLYPLYILVIGADIFLSRHLNEVSVRDCWRSLPYLITATQSWFYVTATSGALYAQFLPRASLAWSISTEFFCYLTYPVIAFALARDRLTPRIRFWLAAATIALLSFGMAQLWRILVVEQAQHGYSAPFASWFAFISPYRRFGQFLIGAIVAHAVVARVTMPLWLQRVLLAGTLGYIGFSFLPADQIPRIVKFAHNLMGTDIAIAFLIFSLASTSETFFSKLMSYPAIVQMGEWSYSIYLLQFFVLTVMIYTLGTNNPIIPKVAIYWTALLVVSALSYRFIEHPCRVVLRRIFSGKPALSSSS